MSGLLTGLRAFVRKAEELDTEAWLEGGLPPGSGLPPRRVLAAQIVGLREALYALLQAQAERYAAYIREHPPTATVLKDSMPDLPAEQALAWRAWLDDVVLRRQWWNADERRFELDVQELAAALHRAAEEAVGTGGAAGLKASGFLSPGFHTLTQAEAKAAAKELATFAGSEDAARRAIFEAVRSAARGKLTRAVVLRDGAGRVVAAASYRAEGTVLGIQYLGALEHEVPGTGVQLVRELAGLASEKGRGLSAVAGPEAEAFFRGVGMTSGTEAGIGGRYILTVDAARELATTGGMLGASEAPSWVRVGWLEGPEVSVKLGTPWDFVPKDLQRELGEEAWSSLEAEYVNTGGMYAQEAVGQAIRTQALVEHSGLSMSEAEGEGLAVARDATGRIIAVASYHREGRTLEIDFIGSDPEAPPGVGRRLMREISAVAAKDKQGLRLKADPSAAGFYERLGMTRGQNASTSGFPIYRFTAKETAAFASGLTRSSSFGGQLSWELAVAGSSDWLRAHRIKGVVDQISVTTHQALVDTLAEGLAEGETTEQLARRVMATDKAFGRLRAERIARTEAITANRWGGLAIARSGGATEKEWRSQQTRRTRRWHREAHGQRVPINDPFIVENRKGEKQELMVPGDYSLGATGDNTIQCRCAAKYIKPGVTYEPPKPEQHGLAGGPAAPSNVVVLPVDDEALRPAARAS